ncbi:MAG TPA: FGGY-family carbohydrate kinase [Ramlibacter sp.]|nr:FGGY-family carbohydrate kinase [Ramlibacter sp.]
MDYVIGVDIGTQSTKALLCDAAGRIVAQHSHAYKPDTPQPLWAEQWPQVWLDAVFTCIARCVSAAVNHPGFTPDCVRGICVSSLYGGSGIPVDAQMTPLHPCLIWMDRRAEAQVKWVREHIDQDRLQSITGNGVDSYYGFTKMLWLKEHRPDVWRQTRQFLPPNAFVVHRLTGEVAVDRSSGGNIGGVYDFKAGTWSAEMLDALGIPPDFMPQRLVASSDIVGSLTAEAALRLGLPQGVPVVAGGIDAAVATFAAGVTRQGQHVAMLGTSMCWGFISREVDASHGLVSMPYVYGSSADAYVFGGAITAGACVSWFREQFCRGLADEPAATEEGIYEILENEARELAPGAGGLLFLPYLMGERSPIWDGQASGVFAGLTLFHRRAALYRAVLEGVTYALRHNMEAGARGCAELDEPLIVVGGAAQSDLWMQIIADVTGRQVLTIQEDVEAAMGAALLAAFGVGLVSPQQAERGWVSLRERAVPSRMSSAYEPLFEVYKKAYPALRETMHDLSRIAKATAPRQVECRTSPEINAHKGT